MVFEETNGIQRGSGIKAVIYGQEGVGKSSLAAQLPGAIFLDCEGSTSKMDVRRLPKPTSWEMLKQELDYILQVHVEKTYKTVIIDTFDWAERLAIEHLCDKHQVNGIEGFGYGKGWEYEAEEIGRFLDSTERLIQSGINVVLLCHAVTRKTSLPEIDSEFDHWELKLGSKTTNKIAPLLKEWSDMTLFLAFQTNVIATDDKGKKHKATSCNRVMYTTKTAWWDAKNRFSLPDKLPLDYGAIAHIFASPAQQLIQKAEKSGVPTQVTQEDIDHSTLIISKDEGTHGSTDVFAQPQPQEDVQTQLILDGIAPELAQLMAANNVTPSQIQEVVGQRGYFPADMPVQNYPQDFVQGCLVAAWTQVFDMIKSNRISNAIPF